jgi:outer membrane protein assembly factor BamB
MRIHLLVRSITIAALSICVALPAHAAIPRECSAPDDDRCESWVQVWDGETNESNQGAYPEEATDSVVSADGRTLYVAGTTHEDAGEGSDIVVMAIEVESGEQLWVTRYEGKKDGREENGAQAIALSPDGKRVYVTGKRNALWPGRSELTLLRLNAQTGRVRWVVTGRRNNTVGLDLVVSPDGRFVYVVGSGRATNENNELDLVLVAFGADLGRRMGSQTYDGYHEKDSGHHLEIAPDGSRLFVLASAQRREGGSNDIFVLAYRVGERKKEPMLAWDRVTHQRGYSLNEQMDISHDGDAVFVVAQQDLSGTGELGFKTVRVETSMGSIDWEQHEQGETGSVLVADDDGSAVYVGGATASEGEGLHPRMVARDQDTGDVLWETVDDAIDYPTYMNDIALDTERDAVYMAGAARADSVDLFTMGFSTTDGQVLWSARFNHTESGDGETRANTISVGPDGFVYAAGEGYGTDDKPQTGSGYNKADMYVVSYEPA